MGWWTEHVVPRLADASLKGREVGELRALACAPLTGRVLELGFGGGLNVRWYPDRVSEVVAVEPSDLGWQLSERRRARRPDLPMRRHHLDGQRLDEPDASYDSVLSTFTLCTIPDVTQAIQEVRRVLKPGGVFCFLEHGLAPTSRMASWQRRLDPIERAVAGGCHLSRDIPALVGSEFNVDIVEERYLGAPSPLTYLYRGVGTFLVDTSHA